MMRYSLRNAIPAIVGIALLTVGCETSSRRVVQTYEYNDAPPPEPTRQDLSEDEYRMQSPGEMVPPGRMVPPGSQHDDDHP